MDASANLGALHVARADLRQLWRDLDLIALGSRMDPVSGEGLMPTPATADELERLAAGAGVELTELGGLLTRLADPQDADSALSELKASLKKRDEDIEAALASFPADTEKARSWLKALIADGGPADTDFEAYVHFCDVVARDQIVTIAGESRAEWRERDARADEVLEFPNMFWTSLDFQDLNDSLARYRFYETFNLSEFGAVSSDIKAFVGRVLLEVATTMEPFGGTPWPNPEARHSAEVLYLVSRSRHLSADLADVISLVLHGLGRVQAANGSLPSPRGQRPGDAGGTTVPADTVATAAMAIAVQKLSNSEGLRGVAARAVDWLLTVQAADGHWSVFGVESSGAESPILQTALALEAITRSGRPNVESVTERGIAWLLDHQDPEGSWVEQSLPNPLLTVLILEAIERADAPTPTRLPAVETARHLILRGERLSGEDSVDARQLAVIAIQTGTEALLYAALESINIRVIENNQTIGLKSALTKVQDALQAKGTLTRSEALPGRRTVERLAYLRNEVVHKGLAVSAADLSGHLAGSRELCSFVSGSMLGQDLFRD